MLCSWSFFYASLYIFVYILCFKISNYFIDFNVFKKISLLFFLYLCLTEAFYNWLFNLIFRVFTIGPGDRDSIPGRVIPKIQKKVLDASLFNTQHYKLRVTGKVEQSRKRNSALSNTSGYKLLKRSLRVTCNCYCLLYFTGTL